MKKKKSNAAAMARSRLKNKNKYKYTIRVGVEKQSTVKKVHDLIQELEPGYHPYR